MPVDAQLLPSEFLTLVDLALDVPVSFGGVRTPNHRVGSFLVAGVLGVLGQTRHGVVIGCQPEVAVAGCEPGVLVQLPLHEVVPLDVELVNLVDQFLLPVCCGEIVPT